MKCSPPEMVEERLVADIKLQLVSNITCGFLAELTCLDGKDSSFHMSLFCLWDTTLLLVV